MQDLLVTLNMCFQKSLVTTLSVVFRLVWYCKEERLSVVFTTVRLGHPTNACN